MSYQPFDRNPSGIVFFGTNSTDQLYESDLNFTFGGDILSVPNITIADNGEIGSATTPNALVIASDGSVTVAGDLTVNGTQTILNTQTVEIEDNILLLNRNATGAPTLDAGFEIERGTSLNVALTYDEGNDAWHFTNDGTTYYDMWTGLTVGGDVNADEVIAEGSTLTIAGGSGLTTTVTTGVVTVDVDATIISGQTSIASSEATDEILVLDATDGNLKRISKGNFISDLGGGTVTSVAISGTDGIDVDSGSPVTGAGTITLGLSNIANDKLANSSLTLAADSGTSEDAALGETVTIAGGAAADTVVSATNTVTVDVKYDNSTIGLNGSNELEVIGGLNPTVGTPGDGNTITADINLVTTGSGNITVTLPAPVSGKIVRIKKIDSGAGGVIVSRNSTDTIDGAVTKILYHRYEAMTVASDGTDWFIV